MRVHDLTQHALLAAVLMAAQPVASAATFQNPFAPKWPVAGKPLGSESDSTDLLDLCLEGRDELLLLEEASREERNAIRERTLRLLQEAALELEPIQRERLRASLEAGGTLRRRVLERIDARALAPIASRWIGASAAEHTRLAAEAIERVRSAARPVLIEHLALTQEQASRLEGMVDSYLEDVSPQVETLLSKSAETRDRLVASLHPVQQETVSALRSLARALLSEAAAQHDVLKPYHESLLGEAGLYRKSIRSILREDQQFEARERARDLASMPRSERRSALFDLCSGVERLELLAAIRSLVECDVSQRPGAFDQVVSVVATGMRPALAARLDLDEQQRAEIEAARESFEERSRADRCELAKLRDQRRKLAWNAISGEERTVISDAAERLRQRILDRLGF